MTRSERLLALLQLLRQHRRPVSGQTLAQGLRISLRTLYRDIASLQSQGADIEGEAGVGYVLRPGFMLPPLMFSPEEIEALVLGSRWVASRADNDLNVAARNALAKIEAGLPSDLKQQLQDSGLLVVPSGGGNDGVIDVAIVRRAMREEKKLQITYADAGGQESRRVIWPIAIGYFERQRVIVGWCELRDDFRHFRTDRVTEMEIDGQRYPRRRIQMLKQWRQLQGLLAPSQSC
ncbi:MAG: helix-turn-helix transcriptional regulator [Allorhizobium sp.]